MKQNYFLKLFLLILIVGAGTSANAQTLHPVSFGYLAAGDSANYYWDYAATRLVVTSPVSLMGNVDFVIENSNTNSGWTDMNAITPANAIINANIVMGADGDTLGTTPFTNSMTGMVALIWRGTNEFGQKVAAAQAAGAIACIIINNVPGQGALGMLASTAGATVTIPAGMISYEEGLALSEAYNASTTVTVSITPWGLNYTNDLGFIPNGYALWHDYAIPANQIMTPGEHGAYDGLDGAFVANYGTSTAAGVVLNSSVSFQPAAGGSAVNISSGTQTLTSFPASDSIWAIYEPNEYSLSTGVTGTGTVTVSYSVSTPDVIDQFPMDDTVSYSFYVTDSLYSKSRYDFVNNHPLANMFESPASTTIDFYLWGPVYYVAKGGTTADKVKWTMVSNTDTGAPISSMSTMYVCLFRWIDGSAGTAADSFMQNGEMDMVGLGIKNFGTADTSGGFFTATIGDSVGDTMDAPALDSNGWYFVAPEMPVSIGTWFLGCDGINNPYPRFYGRANFQNYLEYISTLWEGGGYSGENTLTNPVNATNTLPAVFFGGTSNIDSIIFSTQKGLIPSVSLTANNHPAVSTTNSVKTLNPAFTEFNLFPNPATDYINASVGFITPAKEVKYTIISSTAQVVSTVTHNNVLNETYTYATNRLASGNYVMIVVADGNAMFKKFTVIR